MNPAASQQQKPRGPAFYPFAVRLVAILAVIATPISALGLAVTPATLWILAGLGGVHLLALLLVPVRRLPRWAQIVYLVAQCGLSVVAQTIAPAPLFGYVYLAIVLQAIALFPLWLWIPFAVGVYALWSGSLALATATFIPWLQSNLALAFPATCAIIAAIIYLRQQRRSEQVQQMLQQMQQHYDSLATGVRELQQRAMMEERRRLTQTIVDEVQATLSRTEQSVTQALTQAQTNLNRLQSTVGQTRAAASVAVERLRGTIATLRRDEPDEPPPGVALAAAIASDEPVLGRRSTRVLTWVLPLVFMVLALGLTLSQQGLAVETIGSLVFCSALLLLAYISTQRASHPLVLQIGLLVQVAVVLVMTLLTHTLPLLLGLLLVLWQLSVRLPLRQIVLYMAGLPTAAAVLVSQTDTVTLGFYALLVGAVAAVAVGGPLLLARRQLDRRKQTELRLALLNAEIEQQTAEVRTLAVAAERSRLAREVHDDLGSRLMLVTLQLQLAEELAAEDAGAALEQLQSSREQLRAAWQSVLAVADAALPVHAGELRQALTELVRLSGRGPQLALDGELDDLPAPLACTVYRTVQEGLTNARKHAVGSRVGVHVVAICGYVTTTVTNDCAPAAPPASLVETVGGYGLLGLRERAEALGGGLEVGPTPDGGWRLRVFLPAEGV